MLSEDFLMLICICGMELPWKAGYDFIAVISAWAQYSASLDG